MFKKTSRISNSLLFTALSFIKTFLFNSGLLLIFFIKYVFPNEMKMLRYVENMYGEIKDAAIARIVKQTVKYIIGFDISFSANFIFLQPI
jgi:hypothetical protein